jgi:hypothetical protein
MIAAALLFVGSGVALAHDWNDRNHKPPGKACGHYKVKKQPPGRTKKNFKPKLPVNKRYVVYRGVSDHLYYDKHYRRPVPRRTVVYRPVRKDPVVVFKIVLNDLLK